MVLAALVYDAIWVMNCIEYMGHSGTHICWYYSIVMLIYAFIWYCSPMNCICHDILVYEDTYMICDGPGVEFDQQKGWRSANGRDSHFVISLPYLAVTNVIFVGCPAAEVSTHPETLEIEMPVRNEQTGVYILVFKLSEMAREKEREREIYIYDICIYIYVYILGFPPCKYQRSDWV